MPADTFPKPPISQAACAETKELLTRHSPVNPRSCSSKSLSKDAMFMSLRRRSKAEPVK